MVNKSVIIKHLLFLFVLTISTASMAAPNLDEGKSLFRLKCKQCHNENMKDNMTGPALGGAEERWEDAGGQAAMYAWIRNSQAMVNVVKNPYAVSLYNEWNGSVMTAFPELTDDQIVNILGYIDGKYTGEIGGPVPGDPSGLNLGIQQDNSWLYYLGLFVLGALALVLTRVISNLNFLAEKKANPDSNVRRKSLVEILTSKKVMSFLIFGLILVGGYFLVNNAIGLGRQQAYAPEQPIKFSHATHAGLHQIECQYCHDGARRSKHSVIPAANTCMNCHKAIKKGSEYGTGELTKVFASVGYNPINDTYIDNYTSLSNDEIDKIYRQWMTDEYVKDEGAAPDKDAERMINNQMEDLFSSLTNDQKKSVAGPIEWIRVHNLPDHVYFNHAQHVDVGELECQTCHGKVEEMEVLAQDAPLSMGWCINCHRESDVKFADNPYYESYERYHNELNDGSRKSVTVEDIGGLECQKCHY